MSPSARWSEQRIGDTSEADYVSTIRPSDFLREWAG